MPTSFFIQPRLNGWAIRIKLQSMSCLQFVQPWLDYLKTRHKLCTTAAITTNCLIKEKQNTCINGK